MHSCLSRGDTVLRRAETLWQLLPVTDSDTAEPGPVRDTGDSQHSAMGGHLLRDAKRGRHHKPSGHYFQSAHQRRWGPRAVSFAGMWLPCAKHWLAPPQVSRPSSESRTTPNMPRMLHAPAFHCMHPHSIACTHIPSHAPSPALAPGGTCRP